MDLEENLQRIEKYLRVNKKDAIIAGDINGKSPHCGMDIGDARGQVMTNCVITNDCDY